MSYQPNHILITGATGGIGYSLALAYARSGVRLSLFGRQLDKMEELSARCQQLGASVFTYALDLCDFDELRQLIETIDDQQPVDLVIANAGIAVCLSDALTIESWSDIQHTIDINLKSAIATVLPLVHRMRQRKGGQIALMSSMAAYQGLPISPIYCASKAGLKAFGESLRLLLKKDNIHVSVICPGFVESAMSQCFPGKKPYLISAQHAAMNIKKGLQRNKGNITFPRFLGLGARLLTLLPEWMTDFILKTLSYAHQQSR